MNEETPLDGTMNSDDILGENIRLLILHKAMSEIGDSDDNTDMKERGEE